MIEISFWSWLMAGVVFLAGASLGSFLNVVLYRHKKGENWVLDRSHCENCGYKIAWYDNIPLLSWVILRGKCRACQEKISLIHPVMELLMGMLFVWWLMIGVWFFQLTREPLNFIQPLYWLGVGVMLVTIVVVDFREKIIPNTVNLFLLFWTLGYRLLLSCLGAQRWEDFGVAVICAVVFGSLFWLVHVLAEWIYGQDAFGMGDVKFIVIMGLLLGWPRILVALMVAFGVGSVVGIGLILAGKGGRKMQLALGPFLVVGTVVALIYGFNIWQWFIG